MSFRENIFQSIINNIKNPSFVIDKDGMLVFLNSSAEEYVPPEGFSGNISDVFKGHTAEVFRELLTECLQSGKSVSSEIDIEFSGRPASGYEIILTPAVIESDKHVIICLLNPVDSNQAIPGKVKLSVSNKEISDVINNKEILRIINEVKSTFPFTFLGKNKIQNEINKLSDAFWLKDKDNKYILVNQKFADLLGLKPVQLTGKSELEFIPGHLAEFYKSISSFIESTSNIVIREGLPFPQGLLSGSINVVEFPLCDLDNNVIAVIGITQSGSKNLKTDKNSEITTGRGKMYEILLQTSPEPMFIYDVENLRFLDVNHTALEVYGYTRNEFLQMDLTDLYAPEDIQTLLDTSDSKNKEGVFTGPWRHKRRDGSSILVEISKTTFEFHDKKAHFNIIRDVTERNDLRKELQLLKSVFLNSNDPLFVTDSDGFISQFNDAALKFCGLSKEDIHDRPFITLLTDECRAEVNNMVFHSKTGKPASSVVTFKNAAGKPLKADIVATPVKDYNSHIVSFSIMVKPADSQVHAAPAFVSTQQIPAAAAEAKTSGALDPAFLSSIFHEILTPMNVILGFIQELTDTIDSPTEEQKEAVDIISQNRALLLQTMDSVLEYSHIEQNRIELVPERVIFTELLDVLQNNTKKLAETNGIEFTYGKISSSLSFETDRHRIELLISMFISLAMRITREKKIFLSAYQYDDKNCIISLKDNRVAISEYLLKNLHELFTIKESDIKKDFGASKLSIRLARRLLKFLSGRFEIVKRGEQSAEFGFVFPFTFVKPVVSLSESKPLKQAVEQKKAAVPEPAIEVPEDEFEEKTDAGENNIPVSLQEPVKHAAEPVKSYKDAAAAVKEKPAVVINAKPVEEPVIIPEPKPEVKPAPKIDLSKLKCLYVEDQIDSQILFKAQMKELQKLDFAVSFEAALPLLQQNRYDFIVMDINLQGEYNGLDALRIIRRLPSYDRTHIFAVTAYLLAGDKEKFIAAGFDGFVSKPIMREKLIEVLEKMN